MLFEGEVDFRQLVVDIGEAVNRERTREGVATAPFTIPAEAALGRVVERVALEAGVTTGLELAERAGGLEIAGPPLVSANAD